MTYSDKAFIEDKLRHWAGPEHFGWGYNGANFRPGIVIYDKVWEGVRYTRYAYDIAMMAETICLACDTNNIHFSIALAQMFIESHCLMDKNSGDWSKRTNNPFNIANTDQQAGHTAGDGHTFKDAYECVYAWANLMRRKYFFPEAAPIINSWTIQYMMEVSGGYICWHDDYTKHYATAPNYAADVYNLAKKIEIEQDKALNG